MDTVSVAKRPNTGTKNTTPTLVVIFRPRRITIAHNTSDSSETDRNKAHKDTHTQKKSCQLTVHRYFHILLLVTALTGMSQAERPETQVGCCVRNAAQAVLYGVNGLVQEHIRKVKL